MASSARSRDAGQCLGAHVQRFAVQASTLTLAGRGLRTGQYQLSRAWSLAGWYVRLDEYLGCRGVRLESLRGIVDGKRL